MSVSTIYKVHTWWSFIYLTVLWVLVFMFFGLLQAHGQSVDCKHDYEDLVTADSTVSYPCDVVVLSLANYGYFINEHNKAEARQELLKKIEAQLPEYKKLVDSLNGVHKKKMKRQVILLENVKQQLELKSISLKDALDMVAKLEVAVLNLKRAQVKYKQGLTVSVILNLVLITTVIISS